MTYTPRPIDTEGIELNLEFGELQEAIAKNAHDIWAAKRIEEGWKFGEYRDDQKKETPDLVEYSRLPESEKEYDRAMALNTLRLIKLMGYDIVKREETETYKLLLEQIRNLKQALYCPHCEKNENKKTPIMFGWKFCRECGHELYIDWQEYKENK